MACLNFKCKGLYRTHLNQRRSGVLLLLWGLKIAVESYCKDPANELTSIIFMPMQYSVYTYFCWNCGLKTSGDSAFVVCVQYFNSIVEIVHEILNEVDPLVGALNNTSYLSLLCFVCMKYNLSHHQECHEILNA